MTTEDKGPDQVADTGPDVEGAPPPEENSLSAEESQPEEKPREEAATRSLLDPILGDKAEEEDRKRPIPGGEPECPLCSRKMVRLVERHPAPRGGTSPFRVRLVCPNEECGAWTVYDW